MTPTMLRSWRTRVSMSQAGRVAWLAALILAAVATASTTGARSSNVRSSASKAGKSSNADPLSPLSGLAGPFAALPKLRSGGDRTPKPSTTAAGMTDGATFRFFKTSNSSSANLYKEGKGSLH